MYAVAYPTWLGSLRAETDWRGPFLSSIRIAVMIVVMRPPHAHRIDDTYLASRLQVLLVSHGGDPWPTISPRIRRVRRGLSDHARHYESLAERGLDVGYYGIFVDSIGSTALVVEDLGEDSPRSMSP
ncbi:hypothetical protein NUW54_g14600 [Trametes sanguinea]|uniref:Uncharacterized protein n=1 Tax=Trametes sanguinea TaxID=158606 RepID=A0ACC1MDD4_9APHY|nr:hypothetical protein NUW54_g14600 [Trametes sanguinea]